MLKTRSVTGLQNINRIHTDSNVCYDDTLKANDSNKHGPSTHEKNSHIKDIISYLSQSTLSILMFSCPKPFLEILSSVL